MATIVDLVPGGNVEKFFKTNRPVIILDLIKSYGLTREEAEVLEALMRRLDKQNAKIKRVKWVIEEMKENSLPRILLPAYHHTLTDAAATTLRTPCKRLAEVLQAFLTTNTDWKNPRALPAAKSRTAWLTKNCCRRWKRW